MKTNLTPRLTLKSLPSFLSHIEHEQTQILSTKNLNPQDFDFNSYIVLEEKGWFQGYTGFQTKSYDRKYVIQTYTRQYTNHIHVVHKMWTREPNNEYVLLDNDIPEQNILYNPREDLFE